MSIPAYVSLERLRQELGDMSERTFRRWRTQPGFPAPKRFGLYSWAEVRAFMDGRSKRGQDKPVDQLQEISDAHKAFAAGRPH